MGIFDIFKKKKTDSTFPENELERALIKAATDTEARHEFYTKLLWTELFVISAGHKQEDEGFRILEKDTKVQLITFENGKIPVFTSTNRIFDKGIIKDQVPFMAMKGQDLFGTTKGATLILNPYSDYGKELLPNEIESLLDGTIFNKRNELTIEKDTPIQIGQPAVYPKELFAALSDLFKKRPIVNAAYFAAIRMDINETTPHFMIALDVNGKLTDISREAGPLAENYLRNGEILDFIQISKDGISNYFLKETEPFYKRK